MTGATLAFDCPLAAIPGPASLPLPPHKTQSSVARVHELGNTFRGLLSSSGLFSMCRNSVSWESPLQTRVSRWFSSAIPLLAVLGCPVHGQAPLLTAAKVEPALDGIFAAFSTHPLVGLGDRHGFSQLIELYEAIIRDPRFAEDVRNVVVEFGGAAHQDVIDRYVNGDLVPYQELRGVWTDTVGWVPAVEHLGYAHFFAQVRQTNHALPLETRIRVLLGEPPIDWNEIHTREQWLKIVETRDRYAASVVKGVLARKEKALVIYGGAHFGRVSADERALRAQWAKTDPQNARPPQLSLQGLVETEYPDAFFIVNEYIGLDDKACQKRFEQRMNQWRMPALAVSLQSTALQRDMLQCHVTSRDQLRFPATMPKALQDLLRAQIGNALFRGDAILFVAPAADLTESPMFPDLYLDVAYRQEIRRRAEIQTGQPLPDSWGGIVPTTPVD